MQKLQRFGGAMFTPVLLFAFAGIILSLSIMFQNEMLVGESQRKEQYGKTSGRLLNPVGGQFLIRLSYYSLSGYLWDWRKKQMLVQLWSRSLSIRHSTTS